MQYFIVSTLSPGGMAAFISISLWLFCMCVNPSSLIPQVLGISNAVLLSKHKKAYKKYSEQIGTQLICSSAVSKAP